MPPLGQQQQQPLSPQKYGPPVPPPSGPQPPPSPSQYGPQRPNGGEYARSGSPMRGVQQKEDGRRSPPRLRRVVNEGAGLLRAMQFSGMLAVISEPKKKNPLWWRKLIDEYFLTTAVFKLTLLDYDSESVRDVLAVKFLRCFMTLCTQTRIFRIPFHVMPRFFFTAAMAGNTCSYFTMPGLRERVMTQVTANTPGHLIVECMEAHWTFRYENGWMVNLKVCFLLSQWSFGR